MKGPTVAAVVQVPGFSRSYRGLDDIDVPRAVRAKCDGGARPHSGLLLIQLDARAAARDVQLASTPVHQDVQFLQTWCWLPAGYQPHACASVAAAETIVKPMSMGCAFK